MSARLFPGYPHERKPGHARRSVSISDFPVRASKWSPATLEYLHEHHVSPYIMHSVENVYPTVLGICFTLDGPLNFQHRVCTKDFVQRFTTPPGSPISENLFIPKIKSEHLAPTWKNVVIITEGTTDALAVAQHGVQSCAVMGANPTQQKFTLLQERFPLPQWVRFLVPDLDGPGLQLAGKFFDAHVNVAIANLPFRLQVDKPWEYIKDFCDLTIEQQEKFLYDIWGLSKE